MIPGFPRAAVCESCKEVGLLDMHWDAYYCKDCNKWLESKCDDLGCSFCSGRPKTPEDRKSQKE